MISGKFLSVAAVAVLLSAAYALGLHHQSGAQREGEARLARLESRLAELEAARIPDPHRVGAVAGNVLRATAAATSPPMDSALPDPTQLAQAAAHRRSEFDAAFRREPVDAAWALNAEHALLEALSTDSMAAVGTAPAAFEQSCRSKTCRVVAHFPPGSDAETWLQAYLLSAMTVIDHAETLVTMQADGSWQAEVYAQRVRVR